MPDLMQKKHYYNCLYGFYGKLLTDKQQQIFELSYYQDWSLAEIAEELHISRNAVFDTLKKVANLLEGLKKNWLFMQKKKRFKIFLIHMKPKSIKQEVNL